MKMLYCSICNEKKEEREFSSKEKQNGKKRKCTECNKTKKKKKEKNKRAEVLEYIYSKKDKNSIKKERETEEKQAIERKKMKPEITQKIIKKNNNKCIYCNDIATTADHLKPIKYGGKTVEENLAPCCNFCNNIKDDMTYDEFIALKSNFSDKEWEELKEKYISK